MKTMTQVFVKTFEQIYDDIGLSAQEGHTRAVDLLLSYSICYKLSVSELRTNNVSMMLFLSIVLDDVPLQKGYEISELIRKKQYNKIIKQYDIKSSELTQNTLVVKILKHYRNKDKSLAIAYFVNLFVKFTKSDLDYVTKLVTNVTKLRAHIEKQLET